MQALVAEIDGLTSPPRAASNEATYAAFDISESQLGETGDILAASRKGAYRQSDEYNNPSTQTFEYSYHTAQVEHDEHPSPPYERILNTDEDDENGRIADTRSSKRVRMSASDYQPDRPEWQEREAPLRRQTLLSQSTTVLSPFRTRIQNRVMPRTTTPLRRRTQRAPYSASSRLQYSQKADNSADFGRKSSPARPPLRSLPPMTAPSSRSYHLSRVHDSLNTSGQDRELERSQVDPVETPPSQRGRENVYASPKEIGKTPAHVVQDRLQEAKALMERIRQRASQRHVTSTAPMLKGDTAVLVPASQNGPEIAITPDHAQSYIGDSAYKRRPITRQSTLSRPANPTPTTAALAHQMRDNQRAIEQMATTPEEEEPTYIAESASAEVTKIVAPDDVGTPDDERLDSLAPLPSIKTMKQASATKTAMDTRQLSSSPLIHQKAAAGLITSATSGPSAEQRHLQAPRYPAPSTSSHTSSDRFFTSTSSRYVSGSTAPTSLAASSIGFAKAHVSGPYRGIVNITPAEAGSLLTEDVLGDMIFDDVHKRWVKLDKYLASRAVANPEDMQLPAVGNVPALSPVEEAPGADDEATADDPFRDLTSLSNSKARTTDLSSNSSGKFGHAQTHNRSGSLVLPLSSSQASLARSEEDDRHTEKTSTPPCVSAALPLVSPDLPSIQQASSSNQMTDHKTASAASVPTHQPSASVSPIDAHRHILGRSSTGISAPPKSVLKRSDANAYSTPLPCSKVMSRISNKQTRSVSFSDGKLPGRGDSLDAQEARIASSALRNEIPIERTIDNESDIVDECSREDVAADNRYIQNPKPADAGASTDKRDMNKQVQHYETSRNGSSWHIQQDTPTASYTSFTKPRSLRLKPRRSSSLANSVVSTTSTLAWHRKPLNANATILTECSFGVSYDRLLRVLTDVVPFEPSWKDLEHINLRERGLESVVRLKEFLPNLDEINLSDNNIAYLTGLPPSLRFLSLVNNRLGDLSSFTYLKNLESLDISGNTGVTSIRQLACLRHLRTLKADGCGINSIEGIEHLDGLVTLSICNNSIDRLYLEGTSWTRLETLEASDNNIVELTGLDTLPALRTLNLGKQE